MDAVVRDTRLQPVSRAAVAKETAPRRTAEQEVAQELYYVA